MTLRLRPHHLLCLLTYVGKGYSPAFVENYDRLARRLSAGEDIAVVEGPDDICAPLLGDPNAHCHRPGVGERDRLAARDVGDLLGVSIVAGARLVGTPALIRRMREGFARQQIRTACAGCEWSDLCDTVAASGYRTSRIHGPTAG